jgi:YVTN family beta-propeller protein
LAVTTLSIAAIALGFLSLQFVAASGATAATYATGYVVNANDGTVVAVSAGTNGTVSQIGSPVTTGIGPGSSPSAVAIDGTQAFIANNGSGTVSVLNTISDAIVATVAVGTNPSAVAVSPNGLYVVVASNYSGTVSIISAATDTVVGGPISVGTGPSAIATGIVSAVPTAFVVSNTSVTPIDLTTLTAGSAITLPSTTVGSKSVTPQGRGAALTPDGSTLYVADFASGEVDAINTSTKTVTQIAVGTDSGSEPIAVAVGTEGSTTFAYVADFGSGLVSVIKEGATTDTNISLDNAGAGPDGIAVTPSGASVVAVEANTGLVVNITATASPSTDTVNPNPALVGTGLGSGPAAVAFSAPPAKAPSPTVATTSLPASTAGLPYSAALSALGGTAPYTWTIATGSSALTSIGLSLSTTGTISGNSPDIGSASITVKVTDSAGKTAISGALVINVTGLTITSSAGLPTGAVGSAYSTTLSVVGGVAPYTWSSTGLPSGLTLNATTGVVTGSPTGAGGPTTVHVSVHDSTGGTPLTANQTASITIASAISITPSSTPSAVEGKSYTSASPVTTVSASGGVPPYTYSVSKGSLPSGLSINSSTGAVTGFAGASGTYPITAEVTDSAGNAALRSYSLTVYGITTTSIPTASINQTYSTATPLVTLAVTGGTSPFTWSSSTLPTGLSLNPSTGAITGTPTAPATTKVVTFTVKDSSSPTALSASTQLTVPIGTTPITATTIDGSVDVAYTTPSPLTQLTATGGTGSYTWSTVSGTLPSGLSLTPGTGDITGTPAGPGTSVVLFAATDTDTNVGDEQVTFDISYLEPSVTTSSLSSGTEGTAYRATLSGSSGIAPYSWSVSAGSLPTGLTLSPTTGAITGEPTTAGTFPFTVKLTDSASPTSQTATKALSIDIAYGKPSVTTSSLVPGTIGSSYDASVTGTNGIAPYSWTVSAGSLPTGLSLSTAGAITGKPAEAGTFDFTVKLTDSEKPVNQTATKAQSIDIAYDVPSVTTSSLPSGTVASRYDTTLTGSGGVGPYTWTITAGALPPGLTLNTTTGVVAGTPTSGGTFSFTVKLTDSEKPVGQTATKALSIDIAYTEPSVTTSSLPSGTVNSAYEAALTGSNGVGPYTWTIISGSLPAGLSLSPDGTISGTPTSGGTFDFTVRLTDSASPIHQTADKSLSIKVAYSEPAVTTGSLPSGTVGSAYSATLAGSNGVTPYSWTVTAGSLPPGLTLSSSGTITGTPTASGTSTFTVQLTDSSIPTNQTATASLSISVQPAAVPKSGYDLVGSDGGVYVLPTGQSGGFYGSLPGLSPPVTVSDIVGMVPSSDYQGYFLVGSDGGVFSFGDTTYEGSLPGLNVKVDDIVGIVPSSDDKGYFLVGSDGGVFAFGDADYEGSLPGMGVSTNSVVGIAGTPDNKGYWVVLSNGTVYSFGTAANHGSATVTSPIAGIASTHSGKGYLLVSQDGAVYAFGDATGHGGLTSLGVNPNKPIVAIVPTVDQGGYWLIGGDGGVYAFGDAPNVGSLPGLDVNVSDVVGAVPTQY